MNDLQQIWEDRLGAFIFGLLALGGIYGVCLGAWFHLFTVCVCVLVSWALWSEADDLSGRGHL